MIANGYYDLATPFFATEYTVNHIGLEPALSNHISLTYCDAGHMLYTKKAAWTACTEPWRTFIKRLCRRP